MKKLTVLLIMLIIVSQISICPFAVEITDDEKNAIASAYNYLNRFELKVYFDDYEDDLSEYTIDHRDLYIISKDEILEKAKEYEDEIRENYYYYFWDKGVTDRYDAYYGNEHSALYGCDPSKSAYALKYENTPIEEVISLFPVFIEKKAQYLNAYYRNLNHKAFRGIYIDGPESVKVSESGFAYVSFSTVRFLLYKCQSPDQASDDLWIVCDIFVDGDNFGSKYRFDAENTDVEKVLMEEGILTSSENESTGNDESDNEGSDSATVDESDNKTDDIPRKSETANYTPWVICTAEGVAIIALVIALIFKKKK